MTILVSNLFADWGCPLQGTRNGVEWETVCGEGPCTLGGVPNRYVSH